MNFLELCEKRFSVRKYTSEDVSAEDLEYVLNCVRLAQSAVNFQPWKFLVARSEESKQKLRECYNREWFRSAPMYIICMRNVNENWVRGCDGKQHGDIDVAIATEHLCLAAAERRLGTCWVGNFDAEMMKHMFPEEGFETVAVIPIGHIADDCPQAPKKRKPLNEIVKEV